MDLGKSVAQMLQFLSFTPKNITFCDYGEKVNIIYTPR
jgi:hypothetical protein